LGTQEEREMSPDPRREAVAARVARRLSGIELADERGERVRLGAPWQERPVVLVFLRHFG